VPPTRLLYKALGLKIPKAVTMTGGIYLWKDGREVPTP